MKPKRTVSGYLLLVGVLGLSVVGGLVLFGVYSALVKTQVTKEQSTLIKPLDGQIDPGIINNLQTRKRFSNAELQAQVTAVLPEPEETLLEATPGANLNQE